MKICRTFLLLQSDLPKKKSETNVLTIFYLLGATTGRFGDKIVVFVSQKHPKVVAHKHFRS